MNQVLYIMGQLGTGVRRSCCLRNKREQDRIEETKVHERDRVLSKASAWLSMCVLFIIGEDCKRLFPVS